GTSYIASAMTVERSSSAAPAAGEPLKHEKPECGRRLLQRLVRFPAALAGRPHTAGRCEVLRPPLTFQTRRHSAWGDLQLCMSPLSFQSLAWVVTHEQVSNRGSDGLRRGTREVTETGRWVHLEAEPFVRWCPTEVDAGYQELEASGECAKPLREI